MPAMAGRDTIFPNVSGSGVLGARLSAADGVRNRNGSGQVVHFSTGLFAETEAPFLPDDCTCAGCGNESCDKNRDIRK